MRITDFNAILDHLIIPAGSHGKLGGKAAGLLLARWILEQPEVAKLDLGEIRIPRTWSILSDAVMDFIKLNDWQIDRQNIRDLEILIGCNIQTIIDGRFIGRWSIIGI